MKWESHITSYCLSLDHNNLFISSSSSSDAAAAAAAAAAAIAAANVSLFDSYQARQTISVVGGLVGGLVLGLGHGTLVSGLRFRAENAHRLPTTTKGWYLYHKSKNYYAMWGGLKEGGRMAVKLGLWSGAFVAVEESVRRLRCNAGRATTGGRGRGRGEGEGDLTVAAVPSPAAAADALNTVVAGLATAGAWSVWNRFPLATAARTARMGLTYGLAYGLVQDAWRLFTGRKVTYVEFAKRRLGGRDRQMAKEAVSG